ncbi:Protein Syd (fragment) [Pantoea brenneri]|uniref:Protein Syd n=1 Tax=Pantoea brenneri TaxID=472694 RepID=A0AAX3J7Q8_9GAMM
MTRVSKRSQQKCSLNDDGYNKGGLAALSIAETAARTDRLNRVVPLVQERKRRSSIFRVA